MACAINSLEERDRDFIILRFAYGYNVREIAEMFDLSYFAAQRGILRAKNKLGRYLEEEGV